MIAEELSPIRITVGADGMMILVYEAAHEALVTIERLVSERIEAGEEPGKACELSINRAKGRLAWLKEKALKAEGNAQPFIVIQCGCGNRTVLTTGEGRHSCGCCGQVIDVRAGQHQGRR